MKHTYQITGMTCNGCLSKVQQLLSNVANVKQVDIDLHSGEAAIEMDKHVNIETLKEALKDYPKYQIAPNEPGHIAGFAEDEAVKPWFETYKPILLIFAYILAVAIIAGGVQTGFDPALAMRVFMAGFFLVFSFFKLLNLEGFADSYSMYDVIAKKIRSWAYVYAFIELGLGLAFALNIYPVYTNAIAFVVMAISIVGVLQSVLNKRVIQCACLGSVFNLPMSTVTIIEDALMIVMSLSALFMLL
jgi:copper chaperone CopZ